MLELEFKPLCKMYVIVWYPVSSQENQGKVRYPFDDETWSRFPTINDDITGWDTATTKGIQSIPVNVHFVSKTLWN